MKAIVCVDCFKLVPGGDGSRCGTCAGQKNIERMQNRIYTATYKTSCDKIKANAIKEPTVICWLCLSRTAPEIYNAEWSCDHTNPGDKHSPLAACHLGCNAARGNRSLEWFRNHLETKLPGWYQRIL